MAFRPATPVANAAPATLSFASAPAASRNLTMSVFPPRTAKTIGENLPFDRALMFGARFDQRLHRIRVAFIHGPHERRLSPRVLRGVHVCAVGDEHFQRGDVPGIRRASSARFRLPAAWCSASAPAFRSSSIMAALPFMQARDSGMTP